jgi:hypothetical protein
LRHCASALANVAMYGGAENQVMKIWFSNITNPRDYIDI